jgi:hypothetical protein
VAAFRFEDHRTDIVNGALLTILTGWAWLRVADTHMRLVRAAVKHKVME